MSEDRKPTGTLLLCDHALQDRGKWNLLGVGWTATSAERTQIVTFVTVNVPGEIEGPFDLEVLVELLSAGDLTNNSDPDRVTPLAVTTLSGTLDPDELHAGLRPPSFVVNLPAPLGEVRLRPGSGYAVRLTINGEVNGWVTFDTYEQPKSSDHNEGSKHRASGGK